MWIKEKVPPGASGAQSPGRNLSHYEEHNLQSHHLQGRASSLLCHRLRRASGCLSSSSRTHHSAVDQEHFCSQRHLSDSESQALAIRSQCTRGNGEGQGALTSLASREKLGCWTASPGWEARQTVFPSVTQRMPLLHVAIP